MLFGRIVEGNLTRNGIRTRKVYLYNKVPWGQGIQYDYSDEKTYKKFKYGRYYKDKHFILLQWEKFQIIEELNKIFGKDNFMYVFE